MQIVRKKLSADELNPPGLRYDVITDTVQTYVDGSWVDTPGADPRISVSALLPARTGDTAQCDAAANMTAKIKSIVDYYIATAEQAAFASGVIGIIALFFPPIALIYEVLWAIAEVLVGLGVVVVDGEMTTAVYDRLTCYFFCELDASGQLDQDGYDAVLAAVAAGESSIAYDIISAVFSGLGWVGLNNAGATGSETGDCTDCTCGPWERQFNFCGTTDSWTIHCGHQEANGIQQSDSCEGQPSIAWIQRNIALADDAAITKVEFWVEGDGGGALVLKVYWAGVEIYNDSPMGIHPFDLIALSLTGTHDMLVLVNGSVTGGTRRIPTLRLFGTGTAPAIGHDPSTPPCLD